MCKLQAGAQRIKGLCEFPPAPRISIKVQWCVSTLRRMVLRGHGDGCLAAPHLCPNPLMARMDNIRRCLAVVTWQRRGAAPASKPLQCQHDQREAGTTPEALAERFSEKVAATGANITSLLQPPWMAVPVQYRGCFEWQSTGSESPYNHCWCVPASVYHQAFLWVK